MNILACKQVQCQYRLKINLKLYLLRCGEQHSLSITITELGSRTGSPVRILIASNASSKNLKRSRVSALPLTVLA